MENGKFVESHLMAGRISQILKQQVDEGGSTWKGVSQETKNFYFGEFQKYFEWDADLNDIIKATWESLAGRRYSDMMTKWRKKGRPPHIQEDIWQRWTEKWNTPEYRALSARASANRLSEKAGPGIGPSRHTDGSISIEEHRRRIIEKEGRDPGLIRLFQKCHMKKDGGWIDTRAQQIGERVEQIISESIRSPAEGSETPVEPAELSPLESQRVFVEAIGAQPKDRRVYGLGVKASLLFSDQGSSSHSTVNSNLNSEAIRIQREEMERTIKEQIEEQFQERLRQRDQEVEQLHQLIRDRDQQLEERLRKRDMQTEQRLKSIMEQRIRDFIRDWTQSTQSQSGGSPPHSSSPRDPPSTF